MYIPKAFNVADRTALFELMQHNSFATLVTIDHGVPVASHLPFLIRPAEGEQGQLIAHMARANSQWQTFTADKEVLVIFQGDHAYISPSWYEEHPAVPTWNYAVVHVYGLPRIVEDDESVVSILRELVAQHEGGFAQPWRMDLPADYQRKMVRGIVAFEIALTRIEGKFKLSQNRSTDDQQGVINALAQSDEPAYQGVARMMQELQNK